MTGKNKPKETVVLIHGIFGSFMNMSLDMAYAWYNFTREGYDAQIMNYSTMEAGGIDEIAARLWKKIQDRGLDRRDAPLHFVAHSMGGLVAASIVRQFKPANLGRVVMWGTPLHGSEHADTLNETPVLGDTFRFFGGQAFLDLQVKSHDPSKAIPPDTAMIAGNKSIHPFPQWFMDAKPGEHDGLVPVDSTRHKNLRDWRLLDVTHPGMLHSRPVMDNTLHFLRHGRFSGPT